MKLTTFFFEKIKDHSIIKIYKKNEQIFSENDASESLYVVKNGTVEIFKLTKDWEERLIFILGSFTILNEEILFSEKSECATCCRAYEECEIIIIPRSFMISEMSSDINIMRFILESTNTKLKRTYRQLRNSGSSISVEKKLISKLYRLSVDYGEREGNQIMIKMPISNATLSKMIGSKRETVSRCINKFKKDGLITIKNDTMIIVDINELLKLIDD